MSASLLEAHHQCTCQHFAVLSPYYSSKYLMLSLQSMMTLYTSKNIAIAQTLLRGAVHGPPFKLYT